MRLAALTVALLTSTDALACGQSTHVWVGLGAVDDLPAGHPLRDLLERVDTFDWLVNGAMFPDGGYSPLTQDGYGEAAHWEPFQTAYLGWIKDHYDPPYDGEAAGHVALLMGMAAHGMADQIYDGVYLTRSLFHDGPQQEGEEGVDYATDVVTTALSGIQPVPADVLPYDDLAEVFALYGEPVDTQTIALGQASLRAAVMYIGGLGQQEGEYERYAAQYPWAAQYLQDTAVDCSPACIQPAVAAYWLTIWDRLHDAFDPDGQPVFATWPEDGGAVDSTDGGSPDSVVSVGFSRAIDQSTLQRGRVVVRDAAGDEVPVRVNLYYGDGSNVLNVTPKQGWNADELYTLEVQPGLVSFDGEVLGGTFTTTFTAGADALAKLDVGSEDALCGGRCDTGAGPAWLGALVVLLVRRRR